MCLIYFFVCFSYHCKYLLNDLDPENILRVSTIYTYVLIKAFHGQCVKIYKKSQMNNVLILILGS